MKFRFISILLFSVLLTASFTCFNTKPKFSYKAYGNIANYFENENEFSSFFEFKKGDVVAEIGAGNGKNLVGLSLISDSVRFFTQDIDSGVSNMRSVLKIIATVEKYQKPRTNTFGYYIGTTKETKMPDNKFDKILLVNTFHEFSFMDDMLRDIHKKLKAKGKLYILESDCFGKGHQTLKVDEGIAILKKNNFNLLKHDGKNLNGGTGVYRLVLEKE